MSLNSLSKPYGLGSRASGLASRVYTSGFMVQWHGPPTSELLLLFCVL